MAQGTPGCSTTTVDQNLDHVGGFAKVFRKVWDHPYWQDAERFRAWIDCILLARWRDGYVMWRGRRVFVPRGSFRTSERELVARWLLGRCLFHEVLGQNVRASTLDLVQWVRNEVSRRYFLFRNHDYCNQA